MINKLCGLVMGSGYDALCIQYVMHEDIDSLLIYRWALRGSERIRFRHFAKDGTIRRVFGRSPSSLCFCVGVFYTMPQMKGAGTTLAYIPWATLWEGVVFAVR